MLFKYIFTLYSFLIDILLLLLLIFLGVLADEGVKVNNFAKVYVLGIETNFNVLGGLIAITLVLTIIFQLLFLFRKVRIV